MDIIKKGKTIEIIYNVIEHVCLSLMGQFENKKFTSNYLLLFNLLLDLAQHAKFHPLLRIKHVCLILEGYYKYVHLFYRDIVLKTIFRQCN